MGVQNLSLSWYEANSTFEQQDRFIWPVENHATKRFTRNNAVFSILRILKINIALFTGFCVSLVCVVQFTKSL